MIRVGRDRVTREGRAVHVQTRHEMPDWQVRRYRRWAVRFKGDLYQIISAVEVNAREFVYVLEPWPDEGYDPPERVIEYDEEYVAQRDLEVRKESGRSWTQFGLWLVYPLLGYLPSGWKYRLNASYGVHAVRATWVSLIIQAAIALLLAVWGGILFMANAWTMMNVLIGSVTPEFLNPVPYLYLGAGILFVDFVIRLHRLLSNSPEQFGFYEWLVRWVFKWLARSRR